MANNLRLLAREIRLVELEALEAVALAIIAEAQRILASEGKLATKQLINGMGYTLNKRLRRVRVFNKKPYATIVEFGRRPGGKFPPPSQIKTWLAAKGLPATDQVAYLVGRRIAEKGIAPIRFLSRAFAIAPTEIDRHMRGALGAWLAAHRTNQRQRRIPFVF